ncbi:DNA-directed DNA polymerase [Caenorhabditis elegans]|uniref:DNA-directed DNA polymerase n=1 Tax=Caenorhabditis elegans TaxID=6239 RepID=Q9U208_CAEEL|nr:DNA-directed DNA polymerase [Caenorhabditis elegans]CAB60771.1 DNA-directed DNA polymerase [Caenorhabditis elegans]|eukprot:NP_496592.1 POLG (mitochondrial DNA POLymerase Gamma) [Caenorhabditis elegans]
MRPPKIMQIFHVSRRQIATSKTSNFERKTIETVCPRVHNYLFPHVSAPSTSSAAEYTGVLPPLVADNVVDHFGVLAEQQTRKYKELLEKACEFDLETAKNVLEHIDKTDGWHYKTGWTRYPFSTSEPPETIDFPRDSILFFDIELVVRDGTLPTLAIALGRDAWYGWCSDRLIYESEIPEIPTKADLIPIGEIGMEKVIIGHNVGFDRARCREAYQSINGSKIRFMDTMSMSIPMYGMADHQQSLYEMYDVETNDSHSDWMNAWKGRVSKNSLVAVHDHLYPDKAINAEGFSKKTMRASFVKDPIEQIREDFQPLMSYCARDNILCAEIYFRLWPEFIKRFPHPATLSGMLNMGNVYLPINSYWKMFYEKNVQTCEQKKTAATRKIIESARLVAKRLDDEGEEIGPEKNDVWMWHHDWTFNQKQSNFEWFNKLFKARSFVNLSLDEVDSHHIALKSHLIPAIFGFVFGPFPLFKTRSKGWGFLVPNWKPVEKALQDPNFHEIDAKIDFKPDSAVKKFPLRSFYETVQNNVYMLGELPISPDRKGFELDEAGLVRFYQLDHPSGEGNVGDPLTKHFAKDLKELVLRPTRYEEYFDVVLDSIQTTQFWTSYSDRYCSEVAIWSPEATWRTAENLEMIDGAIAAAVVPAGTISRRSVHKLWVTLTNQSTGHVIGTGIKAMVQAPAGYRLVGADVDSQEQWLAALYGDASAEKRLPLEKRVAGKTAFSNMMLAGSKSDNTDLHSVVASQLKISRNHAKVLNYARLYGSGETHAGKHLMRVGGLKQSEAESTASQLFKLTKGDVAKYMKVDVRMNCVVDKYIEEMVENSDVCKILTIDGIYYMPAYTSQFASETVRFEDWLLSHYSSLLNGSSEPDSLIYSIYENPDEPRRLFVGGYESSTFNFLETSAAAHDLRTPILGCQIADSLGKLPEGTPDSAYFDRKYKRSVMNWIVQSSAVDFLHLLLVSMQWLCDTYKIDARFVISIHDEVRYMCKEPDAPRLALALQLSNLLVRAYISQRVGICQLPNTVAFFSQVDCDTVLRKEVDTESINPDGSKIADGVAWTVDDLLKLTGGKLD